MLSIKLQGNHPTDLSHSHQAERIAYVQAIQSHHSYSISIFVSLTIQQWGSCSQLYIACVWSERSFGLEPLNNSTIAITLFPTSRHLSLTTNKPHGKLEEVLFVYKLIWIPLCAQSLVCCPNCSIFSCKKRTKLSEFKLNDLNR